LANKRIYELLGCGFSDKLCVAKGVGAGGDESKEIDLIAERIFLEELGGFGKINSEESGQIGEGENTIWIDPIDGSDNFISQIPYYGSSVALEVDGKTKVGVIANFANGDIFVKDESSFRVAKLNDLVFSDVRKNENSSVGIFERSYRSKIYARKLSDALIKYRTPGAMALSLAYAHYVDFVVLEDKLREYDVKAGMLMCEDLYKYQYNDLTLICKDERKFEFYKNILLK
jgi:myo-inositol-1(or 4)-monophosphatase